MESNATKYAKYALLDKWYTASKAYYISDNPKMTDGEFDALEKSIIAIAGKDWFNLNRSVGYNEDKHSIVKDNKRKYSSI